MKVVERQDLASIRGSNQFVSLDFHIKKLLLESCGGSYATPIAGMKKKILVRFVLIGSLHTFLYLWLVPFVVYPRFGHNGFLLTVVVAVLISLSILATLFLGRKKEIERKHIMKKMIKQEKYDGA